LAVTTLKRAPRLPDVPTVDESGVPGYDVATWIGAFAPAGTPKSIVGKIEADIKQALAAPEVKAKLEALSMEIRSGASAEMRDLLAGDIGKWGGQEYPDRAVKRGMGGVGQRSIGSRALSSLSYAKNRLA
jgi:tripartite-type tricarboxylate transporter receptor subunit TctC